MPITQKSKGILPGKPLASGGYFVVLLIIPVKIASYEGLADGEDELGDEGGAQSSPRGTGEA